MRLIWSLSGGHWFKGAVAWLAFAGVVAAVCEVGTAEVKTAAAPSASHFALAGFSTAAGKLIRHDVSELDLTRLDLRSFGDIDDGSAAH
jgi:hypothetical protein